jgi:hypothetical protein
MSTRPAAYPYPQFVILRQRSPRQSRGVPTKDLCTLTRHEQCQRKPGPPAINCWGRARLQPGRHDPNEHGASAPEGPAAS